MSSALRSRRAHALPTRSGSLETATPRPRRTWRAQTAVLPPSLPVAFERERVRPVEISLELCAALRQLPDLAATLPARAADVALDAREFELQTLHREHLRPRGFAARLDDELGDQPRQLGLAVGKAGGRVRQVGAQVSGRATHD